MKIQDLTPLDTEILLTFSIPFASYCEINAPWQSHEDCQTKTVEYNAESEYLMTNANFVTLSDRRTALTLGRVVDAAMGFPRRGWGGIPFGHGRHAPREMAFDLKYGAIENVKGVWKYPYFGETRRFVMQSLMLSSNETERLSIIQKVQADDESGSTAGYVSGVLRLVLSYLEPSLYHDLDLMGISLYSDYRVNVWRYLDERQYALDKFLSWIGLPSDEKVMSDTTATKILVHLHRKKFGGFYWFALPIILNGPQAFRFYAVGIPLGIFNRMIKIGGRPDISPLFSGVLDAAVYLCSANLIKYSGNEFRISGEFSDLVPQLRLAQIILAALLSACDGEPPEENLALVFDAVSHLTYENRELVGELILGGEQNFHIAMELSASVGYRDTQLVRKILETYSDNNIPVANCQRILGFGKPISEAGMECTRVCFRRKGIWMVGQHGVSKDLFSFRNGVLIPIKSRPEKEFFSIFRSVFGSSGTSDARRCWNAIKEVREQSHGGMIVICAEAMKEAERLGSRMTLKFPSSPLPKGAAMALSQMDGALLLSEDGYCHGAGLIVDGPSSEKDLHTFDRSRGARYNSAKAYFARSREKKHSTLIVVVSEDGHFDIFPQSAGSDQ